MFLVYTAVGAIWGWQCYRNLQDLLPIQVRDVIPEKTSTNAVLSSSITFLAYLVSS